jgi:P27 family predicted phage terminase small subunit
MGRGRKRMPTSFKILNGNAGRRPLNMDEPQYESGIPDKPEWFDTYASEEWDRLTSHLNGQRVFTKNDLGVLVAICLAYEQMRETHAIIKELGRAYVIEDMGGNKHHKTRPECMRFETALREYRTLLAEIGFSPASRSKIKTLPEPPKPKGTAQFFTS